ncbi:hypothetical protein [Streptomyces sp. WAC08241]|uniref:hypothetical protein n=1 Tax=Streptomyces sp. WAC08241 TaxID=2487421 RepID=UPI000F76E7B4|nr:hypothetical protein [Streptomyces sp. WAC08241]RSS43217.1 hypothetical protein EF906_10200 [Streptomyces sp. WAC08241]
MADRTSAPPWCERFSGTRSSFPPHDTEAVRQLAEGRYAHIVEDHERAETALPITFVDGLGGRPLRDPLASRSQQNAPAPQERKSMVAGIDFFSRWG